MRPSQNGSSLQPPSDRRQYRCSTAAYESILKVEAHSLADNPWVSIHNIIIMALINAPASLHPIARTVQAIAPGSASSSRPPASRSMAPPHQIINMLPDALSRLRADMSALKISDAFPAPINSPTDCAAPSPGRATLALTTVRGMENSVALSSAACLLLGLAQSTLRGPTIHRSEPEPLSVLANSAAISAISGIGDFNGIAEGLYSLALPMENLAKGAGLALKDLPKMELHEKLAIVRELVKAGQRCDEVLVYMGISPGPDVYVMESKILLEIGMPLIDQGLNCQEVEQRLGILSGSAVATFEAEVARRIALPLYKAGEPLVAIEEKLRPTSGSWGHFRNYVHDLEAGREIGARMGSEAAGPSVASRTSLAPARANAASARASSPAIERVLAAMASIRAAQHDSAYVRDHI